MGRKTKITREMILEAAYELLDESGIGAVAIKTIAARLGCSTQPVSWHFGSMTELKKELYVYASHRLYDRFYEAMSGRDAVEGFFVTGILYISNACDHPNVFRFVNVDDPMLTIGEDMTGGASIFTNQFDAGAVELLASAYDIDREILGRVVRDIVIYTHGLAVLMMFDNYRIGKKEACRMVFDTGITLLSSIGIDVGERKFEKIYVM
ncbi:transcriptional regulator, TetR family [Ruminococcaceae bacterium YRB3002]|nr:transcriptional regulator, TetR family [Ruminococcaceae bacterium YRB3002]